METVLIWLLLRRRLDLVSVSTRVVIANFVSLFVGGMVLSIVLEGYIHRLGFQDAALLWSSAFLISWVLEACVFKFRLKFASPIDVWRATFWANVASYTIAAVIFLIYMSGREVPGVLP